MSPAEIPTLEARLQAAPADAEALHRYAAALFAADRCDDAIPAARRAIDAGPAISVGPLALGRCLEERGAYDEALEVYDAFQSGHPEARGVRAIESQRRLAAQQRAIRVAEALLLAEDNLASQPPRPDAVAILPLLVEGDQDLGAISRGLASFIIADLAILQRFEIVERLEIDALIDEMNLAESSRVEPGTAVRVGNMTRAGRTVQGTLEIRLADDVADLSAAVVNEQNTSPEVVASAGPARDLMDLQNELVIAMSRAMGYEPSVAEQALIRQNGTGSLRAFFAYAQGLEAEADGLLDTAIGFYQEALREDPSFAEAGEELRVVSTVEIVSDADRTRITTAGDEADEVAGDAEEVALWGDGIDDAALDTSIADIAGLDGERATEGGGGGDTTPTTQGSDLSGGVPGGGGPIDPNTVLLDTTITIRFVIP